ncbi:MAG: HD domain-containing protein [Chloroflexi bacterium]|nr:HD domain-containing protein [Chloroflexota bacterium]
MGTCLLATKLGEALGLGEDDLRRVYYLSLLQHVGCTAMNHELAAMVGDELVMRAGAATLDLSDPEVIVPYLLEVFARTLPGLAAAQALERVHAAGELFAEGRSATCEVAQMLGARLGFDERLRRDLGLVYERWDGKGFPGQTWGEALSVPLQVMQVAEGARAMHDARGADAVYAAMRPRVGTWYRPEIAEALLRQASDLLPVLSVASRWEAVLEAEPGGPTPLSEERLEDVLRAMAEFVDLKSPYLVGHSVRVANLAERAARRAGLPERDARLLRHAGWVHDLGRVGVSTSLWGKAGPLTAGQWEQVRLHAYYTARVLARVSWCPELSALASMHHERLDGSGYFRAAPASVQSPAVRLLAAADSYQAMTEARPHRAALDSQRAAEELQREVRAGRVDAEAAEAVLEAAGAPARRRRTHVAGLTTREVEVLRLVARGLSTREIAQAFTISPKTAAKHIEHIYLKAGVSTRAAATLFALQHDLLG